MSTDGLELSTGASTTESGPMKATEGHGGYLDNHSTSLYNMVAITSGHPERVVDPPLAPTGPPEVHITEVPHAPATDARAKADPRAAWPRPDAAATATMSTTRDPEPTLTGAPWGCCSRWRGGRSGTEDS